MGLTKAPRIEIFNNRISPIQISWLAFCNTVGFSTIDYLIADKDVIYEEEEKFYTEKIPPKEKQPYIYMINHQSMFDHFMIAGSTSHYVISQKDLPGFLHYRLKY